MLTDKAKARGISPATAARVHIALLAVPCRLAQLGSEVAGRGPVCTPLSQRFDVRDPRISGRGIVARFANYSLVLSVRCSQMKHHTGANRHVRFGGHPELLDALPIEEAVGGGSRCSSRSSRETFATSLQRRPRRS